MRKKALLSGIAAALAMVPPLAAVAQARDVAYQADGYTVYWEEPGYCTLFLDTPRGAMVRVSLRRDSTNFSYVRQGLALDPATPSYPAMFAFDGSNDLMTYTAVDTQIDDGRAGFMLAGVGNELLDQWASARSVTIKLGTVSAKPFDTVSLQGAGGAILALRACAQRRGSPTAQTAQTAGVLQFEPAIPPAPPGDESVASTSPSTDRRFPNGERVSLAFEPAGMGGNGTITHRAPGQPTKSVTIDYMSEFTAIVAANKVQYTVMGTTDQGQQSWACEATIDWRTARIVAGRTLSNFVHPACKGAVSGGNAATSAPSSAPKPNAAMWLAGAWVAQDAYCASGDPLVFTAKGGYRNSGGEIEGTWTLTGNALTLVSKETDPTTGEATGPAQRETVTLTHVGPNELRLGKTRFKRCPTKDGVEPWHANVPFDTE